jgi:hypothetical protein
VDKEVFVVGVESNRKSLLVAAVNTESGQLLPKTTVPHKEDTVLSGDIISVGAHLVLYDVQHLQLLLYSPHSQQHSFAATPSTVCFPLSLAFHHLFIVVSSCFVLAL